MFVSFLYYCVIHLFLLLLLIQSNVIVWSQMTQFAIQMRRISQSYRTTLTCVIHHPYLNGSRVREIFGTGSEHTRPPRIGTRKRTCKFNTRSCSVVVSIQKLLRATSSNILQGTYIPTIWIAIRTETPNRKIPYAEPSP